MGGEGELERREERKITEGNLEMVEVNGGGGGGGGGELDDDGKPRRTGTLWTASAHIVTAVIGSGVLSLSWSIAQLGWIAGTVSLLLFSMVTLYTCSLLTDCYRSPDPVHGERNNTYMAAVKANLGKTQVLLCGICQYVNMFGTTIGYTITASSSARAISKSNCFHKKGHDADCRFSESFYMVGFGVIQLFLSQLPDFHQLWWLSIVAAVMSFAYSFIAVGLGMAKVISGSTASTSLTGTAVGVDVTAAQKVWNSFQALGDIAFSYSYSMLLIEIQDTLRSRPAENKVMKKASFVGVSTTTGFYLVCGCLGYASFGNKVPGNILTGFGFYEPFWLVDFANMCIIAHLLGAYQVFSQPIFAAVENLFTTRYPNQKVFTEEHNVIDSKNFKLSINMFRLGWRTVFVAVSTLLAILLPFFNDILGLLGAVAFWPLSVHFPIEMHIAQKSIRCGTPKWLLLKTLSFLCFLVSLVAAVGSIEGVVDSLKHYTPFKTKS